VDGNTPGTLHLGDALQHAAPDVTTLKVSGNKFIGDYSFIGKMTAVQHLDIEDNNLGGDRHIGKSLPRMISSLGSLKHYAIAGNKFAPGRAAVWLNPAGG
jgi:hypothetical protein